MEVRSASNPGRSTPKKKPVYTLSRKLGGPHGWAGLSGDEKNTFNPAGIRAPDCPARRLVTIPNKSIRTVLATHEKNTF